MSGSVLGGYGLIEAFQARGGPFLDGLAAAVTLLGDEAFYLLLIPLVYWTVSTRLALRLAAFVLFSTWLGAALKGFLDTPRPDPARIAVAPESVPPGGIPSGHAQNAVVTWGFLAWVLTRGTGGGGPLRWTPWVSAGLLALAIGLSRIYRGVHYPVDVVAGWAVGLLVLAAGLRCLHRVEGWLVRRPVSLRLTLALGGPLLLILLFRAHLALPAAAALAGMGTGAVLSHAWSPFRAASGGWLRRGARPVLGLPGAVAIWVVAPLLLAPLGDLGHGLAYGLIGIWVTLGAPVLFRMAGLVPPHEGPAGEGPGTGLADGPAPAAD